jgi:ribosomal protein S27AE
MEDLFDNINEWSYQRFARFYGDLKPSDEKFNEKISIIYDLIVNLEESNLDLIAKKSGCSFEECVLKIKYLKNKRKIGNYYIDLVTRTIKECSKEDELLLQKYSPYLYKQHLQFNQIAAKMPGASISNLKQIENDVFRDICDLNKKGLINGISINEVDRVITYYTIEKHKNNLDTITINCPNCGAINDVNRYGKVRCEYCKTIIEYKGYYY